jgi:hypothetical protein
MTTAADKLQPTARLIERLIRDELVAQGHDLTGKLKKSITVQVKQFPAFIELEGSLLKYGIFVERGVKASRIPYTPGSGKTTSKYIAGLVRFVKLRRIATGKNALSVAFAIAKKHKKEGMPTRNSRKFSKTGARRGFVSFALTKNAAKINESISAALGELVETQLDNLILKGKAGKL